MDSTLLLNIRRSVLLPVVFILWPAWLRALPTPDTTSFDIGGSSRSDIGYGIAVDSQDNIYIAGTSCYGSGINLCDTSSLDLAKLTSSLVFVSSFTYRPTGQDGGTDIAVDPSDNLYVLGEQGNGPTSTWVGKFNASLTVISSITISNGFSTRPEDLLYANGSLYVSGYDQVGISNIGWIEKYDTNLIQQSTVALNGANDISVFSGKGMTVDTSGNIYVAQSVRYVSSSTVTHLRISKFTSSLVFQSSITIFYAGGGPLVYDGSNNFYLAGFMPTNGGCYWLGKFDNSLNLVSATSCESDNNIEFEGAAYSARDARLYVTGNKTDGSVMDFWLGEYDTSLALLSESFINNRTPTIGADTNAIIIDPGQGESHETILITGADGGEGLRSNEDIFVGKYLIPFHSFTTVDSVKVYPNPFSPDLGHTAITVNRLPPSAKVTLFTLTGQKIRELTADSYGIVSWDGKNESGNNVSSGVYFGFAQSNGTKKTFKVVIER